MVRCTGWLLLAAAPLFAAAAPTDPIQATASQKIANYQNQMNQAISDKIKGRTSGCTAQNIVYRREWGSLSAADRISYNNAIKCLQTKPTKSDKSKVPGARTFFDDFQATHIQLTPLVHFDGLFLHFHRYFVWLWEKAVQDCGYNGPQPYWDWTLSYQDPRKSTVFDGSETSQGSNGKFVPHGPEIVTAFGLTAPLLPGTGGGCVEKGPFANFTVNLGPTGVQPAGPNNGLGYNPRCLSRDINLVYSQQTKPTDVVALLATCNDLGCFDGILEGVAGTGVHAGGHFQMGGLGYDPYASPGDPVFFLHHAQIDRMWSLYQGQDLAGRTNQVYGTQTAYNNPPSGKVTLDTLIDYGVLGSKQVLKDLVSTVDGPFCYSYQ